MAKDEVYSWRVTREMKAALEDAARRERASVSGLLERIVRSWLDAARREGSQDGAEQRRPPPAAARVIGTLHGGHARRAEGAIPRPADGLCRRDTRPPGAAGIAEHGPHRRPRRLRDVPDRRPADVQDRAGAGVVESAPRSAWPGRYAACRAQKRSSAA